jgi:hypothetical protein
VAAEFTEYKYRESWWWLTVALLAESKCRETKEAHQKTVDDFVDYLLDYLPTKKEGAKRVTRYSS